MSENFPEETWIFNLVHKRSPDGVEIAFYERQIERFGKPVLELAVGAGNQIATLSPTLQNFTDLFDDISSDETSPTDEPPTISTDLLVGDMRSFSIDQKFRLIIASSNSFQYLLTSEDIESCFDSVKKHLFPYGKFIVEVFNPALPLLCRPSDKRIFVGEYKTADGWIVITQNVFYDAATQINHLDWHYKNQYVKEEQTVSFQMRQFFPQELDALFHQHGFKIEAKYGDFIETPFSSNSTKQIIVASPV